MALADLDITAIWTGVTILNEACASYRMTVTAPRAFKLRRKGSGRPNTREFGRNDLGAGALCDASKARK